MSGIIHDKVLLRAFLAIAFFAFVPMGVAHGQTWSAQTSGTAQGFYDVFFADASTGWAVGDAGTIRATTNGGTTWTAQTSGVSGFLYGIFFVNSSTGWAVGNSGVILETTDGGANWNAQTSGTTKPLKSVFFANSSTGWAVGEGTGLSTTILKTTDGGDTWAPQTPGTAQYLFDVFFANSSTGWAVGAGGTILKTTDGGTNWTSSNSGIVTSDFLHGEFFLNTSTGWVVGDDDDAPLGVIYKTTNGGTSWTTQTPGSISVLRGVFFVDSSTGWAVGYDGTIRATTNGGTTWTAQTSGTTQQLYDVFFADASTGWAVGTSGTILKFTGASSSSNPRRPLTFEEQRQRIASRLAPNTPRDARVVPLSCRNDNCPVEIEFVYAPLELHRGRAVSFVLYDDAGRKAASLSATPALASREYRLSLRPNGGNSAVSGKICAVVGVQESCTPVQGWADIALDHNAVTWSDVLLDAEREEYRLSFRVAQLPANYDVGKTGMTVVLYRDAPEQPLVAQRLFKFSPQMQALLPTIESGAYIIRIAPQNAEGRIGKVVERRITIPLIRPASKDIVATLRRESGSIVGEIITRLEGLLRSLLERLNQ